MVDRLCSLYCLSVCSGLASGIQVPIVSIAVAAGYLYSYPMSFLDYMAGRPEIDGIFVHLARFDQRRITVGIPTSGSHQAFSY